LLAGYFNQLSANSLYLRLQRSAWFLPLVLLGTLSANAVFLVHKAAFYIAGQSFANLGIVLCIDFCIRRSETFGGRLLNCRLALWMGTLSYSLYLWQNPFLNRDIVSPFTSYPVNFVLALCAATFSYYVVERPFLTLKDKRASAVAPLPSLPTGHGGHHHRYILRPPKFQQQDNILVRLFRNKIPTLNRRLCALSNRRLTRTLSNLTSGNIR